MTNLYPPHGVGGYEERCRTVVEGLRSRGHSVTVLTSDYIRGEKVPWERHVARELWLNGLFEAPMRNHSAVHAIEEQNHEVLRTWVRRTAPEAVYVWNMGGLSKSLLVGLHRDGIPYRVDVGDSWLARTWNADPWLQFWNQPATHWERFGRWWRERVGQRRRIEAGIPTGSLDVLDPQAFQFGSEDLRRRAGEAGWPVAGAVVLIGGVPLEAVRRREPLPLGRKILWVGRIQPDRGPAVALEALANLHRAGDRSWTLDLLGRGDRNYQDQLEAEARRLEILSAVSFRTASVERRRELYADYDMLWATGGGGTVSGLITAIEARVAGLPTVLARRDGFVELVDEGSTGWSFTPGMAVELAETTAGLAADPEATLQVAATGQAKACREWGLDSYLEAVETAFESAR